MEFGVLDGKAFYCNRQYQISQEVLVGKKKKKYSNNKGEKNQ